ncbi:unnamed protein product [Diamesa tonsa]
MHICCRNSLYPRSNVQRFPVPDEYVSWSVEYKNYKPVFYESQSLTGTEWADPHSADPNFEPKFNVIDGLINRKSHVVKYEVFDKMPRNIFGRTGIIGRGLLGRFGVNHAADPIVSTWKRDENAKIILADDNKPILRILFIKRGDNGEMALPGGMVDAGENVSATLKREFIEEALNGKVDDELIDGFFKESHQEVYRGYVDDPRNTDNAWMETVAANFHDEDGKLLSQLKFEAGDDAVGISWMDCDSNLKLYASHSKLVEGVAKLRDAHF